MHIYKLHILVKLNWKKSNKWCFNYFWKSLCIWATGIRSSAKCMFSLDSYGLCSMGTSTRSSTHTRTRYDTYPMIRVSIPKILKSRCLPSSYLNLNPYPYLSLCNLDWINHDYVVQTTSRFNIHQSWTQKLSSLHKFSHYKTNISYCTPEISNTFFAPI